MQRTPPARKTLLAFVLAFSAAGPAMAQPLAIAHDGLECWPSDRYPVLSGTLSPPDEARTLRVYFRSENYPDFYFVDATVQPDGRLEAVLPLAAPDTKRVVYYLEAVGRSFETARTREWLPEVAYSDDCRRRDPMLALFPDELPKMVVTAVRAGAPAFPPGFLATGLVAAGSGGIGATAVVGIVAGGVAGGVVIANGGSGNTSSATTSVLASQPSTSIPGGSTSTAPAATTTASSSPPTAPSTTTSAAGGSATTTTTPGGSTTTTAIVTSTTTTTTTSTSTAPVTTTSTSAPTTTSAPSGADMAIALSAPASVGLARPIRYSIQVQNNGPSAATGVRVTLSLPLSLSFQGSSSGSCTGTLGAVQCDLGSMAAGGSATIQITVITLQLGSVTATASVSANEPDPVPGNNTDSKTTNVTLFLRESSPGFVRLGIRLNAPPGDGGDRGEVVLDSTLVGIDDTAPIELSVGAEPGEHVVEAVLTRSAGRRGTWRFELQPPPGVEVAAIEVDSGELVASEPRAVSFHTGGAVGARLRFRYRIEAREKR